MPEYIPDDPLFASQWHLYNTGQHGLFGPQNLDLNVTEVWPEYTGEGITIAIYDNGVDYNHEDLVANYDASQHIIINGSVSDANWQAAPGAGFQPLSFHGTQAAGIAGAADNSVGGVGVAFDATIVGVYSPHLATSTPLSEATQAWQQAKNFDVVTTIGNPQTFTDGLNNPAWTAFHMAVEFAVVEGRVGLGTIITRSNGNSGVFIPPGGSSFGGFDGNEQQFANSRFIIHVGGVTATEIVAAYETRGANILTSAFTGGAAVGTSTQNIWTTDITGSPGAVTADYFSTSGVSASVPQVAGVAALMLEANGGLGWRDVQNIMANASRHTGGEIGGPLAFGEVDTWGYNGADDWNGGGRHYSTDYGYGVIDALAAVRLAESWFVGQSGAATSANEDVQTVSVSPGTIAIPDNTGSPTSIDFVVTENIQIESVRLGLGLNHSRMKDLYITLTSPDGVVSQIYNPDPNRTSGNNGVSNGWSFTTQEFRGELSAGTWHLTILDRASGAAGTIGSSSINFYGSDDTVTDRYVYTNEYASIGLLPGRSMLDDADGGIDTINAAAVTTSSLINLNQGATGSVAGQSLAIAAGADIENAVGGDGNDALIGNALNNLLRGARGDDTLAGHAGNDALDGGFGNDTADYTAATNAVVVDLNNGTANGGVEVGTDTLTSIENATGGAGADYLYGTMGANVLSGGDGNDAIYGYDGDDTVDTGNGTANYVEASYGADTVTGGTGIDLVYGGADNDTLIGGDGNDTLSGDHGVDNLFGGTGIDLLYVDSTDGIVSGGADADYLVVNDAVTGANISASDIENWFGYINNDIFNATGASTLVYMRGADGADTLTGGSAGDYLFGDADDDVVSGGDGDDVLGGDAGADQLFGGNGVDLLYVDHFDTNYQGGASTDYMVVQDTVDGTYNIGSAGIEYAYGYTANDTINAAGAATLIELHGGDGADTLTGGSGINILLGENGVDTLVAGGALTDHFVGGAGADTIFEASNGGTDYFYDYQDGTDHINLDATGLDNFGQLTINNTYAASNWYGVDYGTGTLWVNTGGVGTLDASDFIF